MQQLSHSYSVYEYNNDNNYNNSSQSVNSNDVNDVECVRAQLDTVIERIKVIDELYGSYMTQYNNNINNNGDNNDYEERMHRLSVNKRELIEEREALRDRLQQYYIDYEQNDNQYYNDYQKNDNQYYNDCQQNNNQYYDNVDYYSVANNSSNNNSRERPPLFAVWSMEEYHHTRRRTLDRHKFVNPGSLLGGGSCAFGQYNYTYFNDQPDEEEVQVYEYPAYTEDHRLQLLGNTISPRPLFPLSSANTTVSPPVSFCAPLLTPTALPPPPSPAPLSQLDNTPSSSSSNKVHINDILNRREDSRHVIIIRGLPGAGKSSFCQSFKEKELANGHSAPRILSIDPFFMEDGHYEYDRTMEPRYREELFKIFKRQIDEGFFSVILLDSVNEKVEQFSQFYYYAKISKFQPTVLELRVSPTICAKRSEMKLQPAELYQIADRWEETPAHFTRLDATSFLQDSSIEDVEMEDVEVGGQCHSEEEEEEDDDDEEVTASGFFKSKWDEDFEERKERLDGRKHVPASGQQQQQGVFSIGDFLRVEEEELYSGGGSGEGGKDSGETSKKKRVKWADFEELKKQKRRKELGFVAGYTDWSKIMSDDIVVAEAALVQVRHFVKDS